MTRYILVALLGLGLAACSTASTDDIGTRVSADGTETAPGSNAFRVVFDPNNPGIPAEVYATSFKDEENVRLSIRYPDGTTWEYTADSSTGSKQTAAIVATQEAVAALQAETGQAVAPAVQATILGSVRAALGIPAS